MIDVSKKAEVKPTKEKVNSNELDIEQYMEDLRKRVDDRVDYITEKYEFLDFLEPIRYTMAGPKGGKKIRPSLATMVCQALGGQSDDRTLEISVLVELMHQGSLVIDDILDGDVERRGQQALWVIEQAGKTAVGGMMMFIMANKIGAHRIPRAKDLVFETIEMMAKGNKKDVEGYGWDEDAYMKMIYGKTAFLFAAASKFGAIMADANDTLVSHAFEYGRNIGVLYQLTDDLVDVLKSKKTGTLVGDMRRGKITHVALHMRKSDKKTHKLLDKYASKNMSVDDLQEFFKMADKCGSINSANDAIFAYHNSALASLSSFPDNKYTDALKRFPDFIKDALMKEV